MDNTLSKRRITITGLLLMIYFSLIACKNSQLNIYGGFIALVGSIFVDKLFSSDRLKITFPTSCKCLYYFTVFCYFSRFWAWELYYVQNLSKQLIAVFLLITISVGYFIKIKNPSIVIAAIGCVGVVLSCYVIYVEGGFTAFYQHATRTGARIGDEVSNVNRIGMSCAFSTVVLIYYGIIQKKRRYLLPAVLTFMVAAASGSRKSLLLLGAGIVLMVLLSQKDRQGVIKFLKVIIWLCIGFVVLKMIISLDIMSTVKMRWEGLIASLTGDSLNADASADSRIRMIRRGWSQFLKDPLIGIGVGNSKEFYWRNFGVPMYLHNDYIEHLVNGGIVGFSLYYGNIVYIFVRHIKLMKIRKDPEIIMSFIILVLFLIMNLACVTYYDFLQTALYFILWITTIEVKKIEFSQIEQESLTETENSDGGDVECIP